MVVTLSAKFRFFFAFYQRLSQCIPDIYKQTYYKCACPRSLSQKQCSSRPADINTGTREPPHCSAPYPPSQFLYPLHSHTISLSVTAEARPPSSPVSVHFGSHVSGVCAGVGRPSRAVARPAGRSHSSVETSTTPPPPQM